MTDKKISELPTGTYSSNIWLPAIDPSQPSGQQNVKLAGTALVAGISSSIPETTGKSSLNIDVAAVNDYLLYAPTSANDVLVFYINFAMATLFGGTFTFDLYAGNPATGGVKVYGFPPGTSVNGFTYSVPLNVMVPHASGSNEVWIRITNQAGPLVLNLQISVVEISAAGSVLAGYVPPPPYMGPPLNDVYVAPDDPYFPEPCFAVRALADGGTMHIAEGTYYIPFALFNPGDIVALGGTDNLSPHQLAQPYINSDPNMWGTTTGGVDVQLGLSGTVDRGFTSFTIQGAGAYKTIFNGRGGSGAGHRLQQGKAFFLTSVPCTIQDCGFINCGGILPNNVFPNSGGIGVEAAVYALNYPSTYGLFTVRRCSFDNNSTGVFVPIWETSEGTLVPNPRGGLYVDCLVDSCDFGLRRSNGSDGSGSMHDMYVQGNSLTVTGCNYYGIDHNQVEWAVANPPGHIHQGVNIHSRVLTLTVENTWGRALDGRVIDNGSGGNMSINNCIFEIYSQSTGWIAHAQDTGGGAQNPHNGIIPITNTVLRCGRFNSVIWIADESVLVCSGVTQEWYLPNDDTGVQVPSLNVVRDNVSANPGHVGVFGIIDHTITSGMTFLDVDPAYTASLVTGGPVYAPPVMPNPPGSVAQPGYVWVGPWDDAG